MNPETFTYTISSNDRINGPTALVSEYYIDFGGIPTSHTGRFKCDVAHIIINGYLNADMGYVLLTCEGLHSGGYYSNQPSNICTLGAISTTRLQTPYEYTSFIIDNCRVKKRIRFVLLSPNYLPLTNLTHINRDTNMTDWKLILRLTPIEN